MAISFDYFQTRFTLSNPNKISTWIQKVVKAEKAEIESLSFVFCTDKYLLKINQDYLDHDTLTDIITFDFSEERRARGKSRLLEGEIYISIPRVRENARLVGANFEVELRRVIIHGVLHLLGYKDKSVKDKKEMRAKEDLCLGMYGKTGGQ